MKQIKMFVEVISEDNLDDEVNKFLKSHNVVKIQTDISQGFTYTSSYDLVTRIDSTIKPSIITTIIYEVAK